METIDEKTMRAMNYADSVLGEYGELEKWELCCDSHIQGANEQDPISRASQKAQDIEDACGWLAPRLASYELNKFKAFMLSR